MILVNPIWGQHALRRDPHRAFVIMPFAPKWSAYIYNDFIKPAVIAEGLDPRRADEMTGRNVLQDIWSALYASRLVIAELTERNANVYYELGIAHTLGKPAVLLAQDINSIPFDLRHQRVIVYSDDLPGYSKLQRELPSHLKAILSEPVDEIQHVSSIFGGYFIEGARSRVSLHGPEWRHATITDDMSIIGTRENVVLLNKSFDHTGVLRDVRCNHRFTRSTGYADKVRVAALFNEPYVQTGTREKVAFTLDLENAFVGDQRRWTYHVTLDTRQLVLELTAANEFGGRVRLVRHVEPTDYDMEALQPHLEDGQKVYRGIIENPELGATYALVWS
jgi:hypothetical protein